MRRKAAITMVREKEIAYCGLSVSYLALKSDHWFSYHCTWCLHWLNRNGFSLSLSLSPSLPKYWRFLVHHNVYSNGVGERSQRLFTERKRLAVVFQTQPNSASYTTWSFKEQTWENEDNNLRAAVVLCQSNATIVWFQTTLMRPSPRPVVIVSTCALYRWARERGE
jgi:hypothetical protein